MALKAKKIRTNLKELRESYYSQYKITGTDIYPKPGLSQAELAKMVETSPDHISNIECGRTSPSVHLSLRIAKIFNKPIKEIFYLVD